MLKRSGTRENQARKEASNGGKAAKLTTPLVIVAVMAKRIFRKR
jgi:hypothetical protein